MRIEVLVAAALVLAGCTRSHANARGRAVFERACSGCHSLTGHDTNAPGGDLRVGHLTSEQVASFARVMPVHPPLGAADLQAVAHYVAR